MSDVTFSLKTLLRAGENQRDQCRAQLADALRDEDLLAQRQVELDRQRRELTARCREAASPGELDVEQLKEYHRHQRHLIAEQERLAAERQQAADLIETRREELLAADRKVRALEKLDAKQRRRLDLARHRRQRREFDELAATARERMPDHETL
ncbi:MAG: flagellar FliJ family protein [Pirellulales bacterium]|nr:flagellar FliJ family protein [Pirellulales bacterium]